MPKVSQLAAQSPATVAALRDVLGIDTLEAGQAAGMLGFETKALMDADLAHAAGTLALVTNDATSANNGTYRKTGASGAGTWVLSADRVTEIEQTLEPIAEATLTEGFNRDDLMAFIDAAGKAFGIVGKDAAWSILLKEVKTAAGLEIYEYESLNSAAVVVTDADGKILGKIEQGEVALNVEVAAARGTRTSLDDRLSQQLSPYGLPKRHVWGEWYLRETRQRLRKRLLGESTQLVVASIGDSWTHSYTRWSGPTAASLKTSFGDAGAGYVSFASLGSGLENGNVLSNSVVTYTGSWTISAYFTAYSPDIGQASSSSAGAKLSYTIAASPSAVKLYAQGGAGVVRYRYNGGSWTNVDLSVLAAGMQVVTLAAPSAGVFDVEVVSGTPVLFGIDVQTAAAGVRWHKLGATGSRAQHWAAVDATNWKAGITALAPNLVVILLGTNDQANYDAGTYKAHVQTMVTRVKQAVPLADVLLVAPCENGSASAALRPMADYAAALYELAATNNCAYLDLQYVFGDAFSEYNSASARAWFNADNVHPDPSTGGRAIVDAVQRLLTQL